MASIPCRFCLKNDKNLMDILALPNELNKKIEFCLNLKLKKITKSPIVICKSCKQTFDDFSEFLLMCRKNLNSIIPKVKEKQLFTEFELTSGIDDEDLTKTQQKNGSHGNCSLSNVGNSICTNAETTNDLSNEATELIDVNKKTRTRHYKQCQFCGIMVTDIKIHLLTHSEDVKYKCDQCGKGFKQRGNLTSHLKIHANTRDFKCELCSREFVFKHTLKEHMYTHSGEKNYKCNYCEKTFITTSGRSGHMKHHIQDKKHECTYCDKTFLLKHYLKKHLRIHTGEKPYKCSYCDKGFTSNWNLKTHLRTHTKEKPYKCTYCAKAFSHLSSYNEHINVHSIN